MRGAEVCEALRDPCGQLGEREGFARLEAPDDRALHRVGADRRQLPRAEPLLDLRVLGWRGDVRGDALVLAAVGERKRAPYDVNAMFARYVPLSATRTPTRTRPCDAAVRR